MDIRANEQSSIRANIPLEDEGLVSPGLKKFGSTLANVLSGYLQELGETFTLPGRIYKGEAQPTLGGSLEFATRFAGGGFGRGGFGMGARRLAKTKPVVGATSRGVAQELVPGEDEVLNQLMVRARQQQQFGKTKFFKKKVADLGAEFESKVIDYGRIPEHMPRLKQLTDRQLTDITTKQLRYQKMLSALEKETI